MGGRSGKQSDRERIRAIRQGIEAAENAGDPEAFGQYLADDVAMKPAAGPHRQGFEAVVEFHREHFDTYDIEVEFAIEAITVVGDLASEQGTYTATLTSRQDGRSSTGGGECLYVYERDSDEWNITRMSW
jgi:uncharacterized protein (TIGR02246 family)